MNRWFKTDVTSVCDMLLACKYLEACGEGSDPYVVLSNVIRGCGDNIVSYRI